MDSKDIELKSALDEIFGDDIIELDEDIPVIEKKELTNEELFENTSTLVINQNDIIDTEEKLNLGDEKILNDDQVSTTLGNEINKSKENNDTASNDFYIPVVDKKNENIENDVIGSEDSNFVEQEKNSEEIKEELKTSGEEKKSNIPVKKVIIICILVVLLTITGVYFIADYISNKEKVINCSYSFDDKNYKITDEYKITFKNKKITYIEGVYTYFSKTNEYDEQIKYIKEDKLPAIINSNGMKGFTYTYENTEDSIKISSYLDYNIMDENEINSIDQNAKPISYFRIDLKENSKNLINLFEKQGYKCITSK